MYVAKGSRVKVRELLLEDVYEMGKWGKHEDPLFYDYNFPILDENETKEWYNIKMRKKSKLCYAILNEEEKIIGYLAIKNIKRIKKCATLGIVFDPNYINKGYGTEAIITFLKYFFNDLGMKVMTLDVAKYNKRALRCYRKCGFDIIDEYKDTVDIPELRISDVRKYEGDGFFDSSMGIIYCYIYKMKITFEKYKEMHNI